MSEALALTVIAAMSVVWVLLAAVTMAHLRRTLKEARELMGSLQSDLVPLLRQARQISEQVESLSEEARRSVRRATSVFQAIGEWGETIGAGIRRVSGWFHKSAYEHERRFSDD